MLDVQSYPARWSAPYGYGWPDLAHSNVSTMNGTCEIIDGASLVDSNSFIMIHPQ